MESKYLRCSEVSVTFKVKTHLKSPIHRRLHVLRARIWSMLLHETVHSNFALEFSQIAESRFYQRLSCRFAGPIQYTEANRCDSYPSLSIVAHIDRWAWSQITAVLMPANADRTWRQSQVNDQHMQLNGSVIRLLVREEIISTAKQNSISSRVLQKVLPECK